MKNVLHLVRDDDGQEARVRAAPDLTCALNGHMTCLDIVVVPHTTTIAISMGSGSKSKPL